MRSLQIHEKPTEKSPALLPGQVSGTQVVPQSGREKPGSATAELEPPIEDRRHNMGASLSKKPDSPETMRFTAQQHLP
jgi:hypothetical protein